MWGNTTEIQKNIFYTKFPVLLPPPPHFFIFFFFSVGGGGQYNGNEKSKFGGETIQPWDNITGNTIIFIL